MEKRIAIQGHPTRGAEVIKALENMGGKNVNELCGDDADGFYFNKVDGCIECVDADSINYVTMTLEEYLDTLPKAEIADRLALPCGYDKMEVAIPDDCEIVNEDGKWVLRRKETILWIARDEDGDLYLFQDRPTKLTTCKNNLEVVYVWEDDNGMLFLSTIDFPEVTFENSPKKVKLTLMED